MPSALQLMATRLGIPVLASPPARTSSQTAGSSFLGDPLFFQPAHTGRPQYTASPRWPLPAMPRPWAYGATGLLPCLLVSRDLGGFFLEPFKGANYCAANEAQVLILPPGLSQASSKAEDPLPEGQRNGGRSWAVGGKEEGFASVQREAAPEGNREGQARTSRRYWLQTWTPGWAAAGRHRVAAEPVGSPTFTSLLVGFFLYFPQSTVVLSV